MIKLEVSDPPARPDGIARMHMCVSVWTVIITIWGGIPFLFKL